MKKNIIFCICLLSFIMSCNQTGQKEKKDEAKREKTDTLKAEALLTPASGSNASGKVVFKQIGDSIKFILDIRQVTPGIHAVHLHEKGDCSAKNASSAGGHWNPDNKKHGKRGEGEYHKGDIDNFIVREDSIGYFEMIVGGWTIGGPEESNILNKAVIVHANADDFSTQPTGDAGPRIACGVIKIK